MMRGQLSLEFLLVFTIFLALLLISLGAISKIRGVQEEQLAKRFAALALNDIVNSANEVCILGDGNSRLVRTELESFSLERLNGTRKLRLCLRGGNITKETMCDVELLENSFSGQVVVRNEQGKVIIE